MKTVPHFIAAAAMICITISGTAHTGLERAPLAIKGYSPVSYFDPGEPQKGSARHSLEYNKRTYYFTSAEQKARFEANPDRYEPRFPDHCPYNLALGREAAIDPHNFRIVQDTLLLFHRSEEMDGREMWESHGDDEELLEQAEANYTLFRF